LAISNPSNPPDDRFHLLKVDDDGEIHALWGRVIGGGGKLEAEIEAFYFSSVTPDGTPAGGFNGLLTLPDDAISMRNFGYDPTGRLIVTGVTYFQDENFNNVQQAFAVGVLPDGTLDPTYADAGTYRTGQSASQVNFWSYGDSYILPDGRVLISGNITPPYEAGTFVLLRLRGAWDVADNGAMDETSPPAVTPSSPVPVVVPSPKSIAAPAAPSSDPAEGQLDTTFGANGIPTPE